MGVRDALLHNITGSNFEALQSGDTARIKGDFSVKNTSDVEIFGVDVSSATVNVAGNITSTMNVSGSVTSTGSFGRFVASTYQGDGSSIRDTLPRSIGLITSSAQLSASISGAFQSGFFFGFQASSSISGGLGITGSFGRVEGEEFFGSGVGLQSTLPRSPGLVTGSAQLASRISGSFNKGFEFSGNISGSSTSTGSFGRLESTTLSGDATNLRTTLPYSTGLVTGSAQLANQISGSFTIGFEFTNKISGSSTSTGSFGRVDAIEFHGDGTALRETLTRNTGTVTGSAQLASRISGSFTSGFAFTTTSSLGHATGSLISASAGGTANLTVDRVKSNFFTGDGANLVQLIAPGLVSGSAQLGVSGSFTSGFQYKNQISGSVISTGSFGRVDSDNFVGDGSLLTNIPIPTGLVTGSGQLAAQISGAFTSGFEYAGKISGSVTSTGSFGRVENATYFGDGSNIKDTLASRTAGVISGSAQIAADISGSFNKGFEVTGNILDQKAADHDVRIAGNPQTAGVWTTAANMINSYHGGAGAGNAQNAALHFAGRGFPTTNADTKNTEEWNGSSWTEVNNMINTDYYGTGAGSSESALWMGGYTVPSNKVNEYNGTNWSERATLPGNSEGVGLMKGIGIGRDANVLHIGGATGGTNSNTTSCAVKKYSTSTDSWSEETNAPANLGFVGGAGTTEAAIIAREHDYNSLIYNGSSWSTIAAIIDQSKQAGWGSFGTQNDALIAGGSTFDNARRCTQLWNGTSWSEGNAMNLGRGLNAGKMQGGSSGAAGIAFSTHFNGGISAPPGNQNSDATELYNAYEFSTTTGSFSLVKPRGGGINTEAFQVTSASLFKLPVFSDRELNYQAYEAQYSTGSLSGSVDRVADVIVGQNLGEMWFDSDKNAIGYTYQSNSLTSQSLDFGTFTYTTSSIAAYGAGTYNYSSSIGLFTQSFFSNTVVTCYLTGSQI